MTPAFKVTERKLTGSPHTVYAVVLADGRVAWEQLSPYGKDEAAERAAAFLAPVVTAERKHTEYNGGKSAGRPRRDPAKLGASVDYEMRVDE